MNERIRCMAIDDEPLALDILEKFCQRVGNIDLRKCNDPVEGLEIIQRERPDIVFLDIEMDGVNGLQIASRLPESTCFIFTTAYLKYALEGFDLDAVDYLHKPFSYARFQTALSKALRRIGLERLKTDSQSITLKQGYNNVAVPLDDILYIEAIEGYSKIYRISGEYIMSRILLKNIMALLPGELFLRIHRSFIVSRSKIKSFSKQEVTLIDGASLPIGRQYASVISDIIAR